MTLNENLRHMPLLRLLVPFLSGDILGLAIKFELPVILLLVALTFITIYLFAERKIFSSAVSYRFRWTGGLLVIVWLLLFGFLTGHQAVENITLKSAVEKEKSCICSAAAKETVSVSEKGSAMILKILKCDADSSFEDNQVLAYFEKDSSVQMPGIGDRVLFKGFIRELSRPTNPAQFNYKQYMFYHKVVLQTYISPGNYRITDSADFFLLRRNAASIRDKVTAIYRKYGIVGQQFAVLEALTLGDKNELDKETVSAFAKSGAMHVLAVSGLHTGIIYLVFAFLLKFLDRSRFTRIIKFMLLLLVLWAYAFLTGLSPSVTRAAFMFSFLAAGKVLNRNGNIYNTIAASAFVLILINPFIITYAGFQFSYA
ncbi:MAG TPA: ComEC/Rec2 family competence protein, partial [Bacteroidales bacterium]|nr:ComEC/Rec2 family competence protein [Bacteroidales bacterium]